MHTTSGLSLAALALLAGTGRAQATPFAFAGLTWQLEDTPDVLGLLGDGADLGGAVMSPGFVTSRTPTEGLLAASGPNPYVAQAGFDPSLSLGRQLFAQHGIADLSSFTAGINLPAGNDGTASRHAIEVSWSAGRTMENLIGDDFVVYESAEGSVMAGNPVMGGPDGQMVRARLAGTASFTDWHYRAVDSLQYYWDDGLTGDGAFATAFDLADLGVAPGQAIDRIQIANLMPGDRIDVLAPFALAGRVVFGGGAGLAQPSVGRAIVRVFDKFGLPMADASFDESSTFAANRFDPDPMWVASLHGLTPGTCTGGTPDDVGNTLKIVRRDPEAEATWAAAARAATYTVHQADDKTFSAPRDEASGIALTTTAITVTGVSERYYRVIGVSCAGEPGP